MKEFKGKLANIIIDLNGKIMYFNGIILDITETHLTFKDRVKNKVFSFNLKNVVEIRDYDKS